MSRRPIIKESHEFYNVACFEYQCGRCGRIEVVPQVTINEAELLAPDHWCCVAKNRQRSYYCPICAQEIGIFKGETI